MMTRSTNMEHVWKVGDRVRALCGVGDYIRSGDVGTVAAIDCGGCLWCTWDNPVTPELDEFGWCIRADEVAPADAAIASLSAPKSRDAESKLAEAGVFAGHHGLRGLADADEFWEKQPYGTRLYYGDGGMDYLHRGVLQKAVEILDAAPQPPAEAQAQGDGELWHMVAKLAAHVRPTCGELWAEAERLLNRAAPPSAPVGVESEVLRRAADELRRADALARKSDKIDRRKVIGRVADNNLSVILSALDSLSAPQPAAEAQPVAWIMQDKDSGEFWPESLVLGSEPTEDEPDDAEWMPLFLRPPPPSAPVGWAGSNRMMRLLCPDHGSLPTHTRPDGTTPSPQQGGVE